MSGDDEAPPGLPFKVVVPLDGGREFVLWLPKPASELTMFERDAIYASLVRQVKRRGQA